MTSRTQSLHYFHSFAIQDRVSALDMPDSKLHINLSSLPLNSLLPTEEDLEALKASCVILLSRVLVKYIPAFAQFAEGVVKHIPHKYQDEMSRKSKVVSKVE